MAVESFPHQDALEIRMTAELDAEHVERLALVPVRRFPDRRYRRNGTLFRRPHAQPHARVSAKGVERVRDAESWSGMVRIRRIVGAAEINEIVEAVVLERAGHFDDALAIDDQ